jgi:hypothetical protein
MASTIICAGGSGARILESVVHLCAAGLGPQFLRILAIDPDGANGNNSRVKELIERYNQCREILGHNERVPFFRTEFELLQAATAQDGLDIWTPVSTNQRFDQMLNYALLPEAHKDVVNLLFTEEEREMPMNVGFRGHPAMGAAAMSLLPRHRQQAPWRQLAARLQNEVNAGETRVLIAGSVFGGTGASVFHPLTRFLKALPQTNADNLVVGAICLAPYFQFQAADGRRARRPPPSRTGSRSPHAPPPSSTSICGRPATGPSMPCSGSAMMGPAASTITSEEKGRETPRISSTCWRASQPTISSPAPETAEDATIAALAAARKTASATATCSAGKTSPS